MPHETYWLPYPALLKKKGFTKKARQRDRTWERHDEIDLMPVVRRITLYYWSFGSQWVELRQNDGVRFLGELKSAEEFEVVLRQIGWSDCLIHDDKLLITSVGFAF